MLEQVTTYVGTTYISYIYVKCLAIFFSVKLKQKITLLGPAKYLLHNHHAQMGPAMPSKNNKTRCPWIYHGQYIKLMFSLLKIGKYWHYTTMHNNIILLLSNLLFETTYLAKTSVRKMPAVIKKNHAHLNKKTSVLSKLYVLFFWTNSENSP